LRFLSVNIYIISKNKQNNKELTAALIYMYMSTGIPASK